MKKCWDSNPSNRPTIRMLENIVSEWIRCINEYYKINRDGNYNYLVPNIDNQLKDDMLEFVKANKTLVQEQANTSIMQSHPQAYYISRKFTGILAQEKSEIIVQEKSEILAQEKSECFECIISVFQISLDIGIWHSSGLLDVDPERTHGKLVGKRISSNKKFALSGRVGFKRLLHIKGGQNLGCIDSCQLLGRVGGFLNLSRLELRSE
uniref:Serine-threonine/tyrosine-protein kinase catalytic domain-containing protein n=1 Tax=Rhizophagus irregularis (strain DAOM 181602 / DAOM 197198 / MUCL 43194) TaxID=747089 RepID=U9UW69_RHIID